MVVWFEEAECAAPNVFLDASCIHGGVEGIVLWSRTVESTRSMLFPIPDDRKKEHFGEETSIATIN